MDHKLIALKELQLLEAKVKLQENLPHLHGWKFYPWARNFWESQNKIQLICAANQISKSSTLIRKFIHWATAPELWPQLWAVNPLQFWYLYPTRDVAHIEYMKKWVPEFLPKGEFRYDHPIYGWKPEFYHSRIFAIHFNSGVSIYFKSYAQDATDLQTGTVWMEGWDEECPVELIPELSLRVAATDGYICSVFTPTLGQEYWRRAIEEIGNEIENFKGAHKQQVTMYDCLYYEDGSRSPWTEDRINRIKNTCRSKAEIERRVYGKFVQTEGLKYPAFHRSRNVKKGHPIPKSWRVVVGADIGSGGENHPSAVVLLAVSPDLRSGRVFDGWRGDGEVTTASDVVDKVKELVKKHGIEEYIVRYDQGCRDFYTIASNMGMNIEPSDKGHDRGETILNTLFKNQMLYIYDEPQLDGLIVEFSTLSSKTPKRQAKDDFIDACRYACTKEYWDWSAISGDEVKLPEAPREPSELEKRRQLVVPDEGLITLGDDLGEWNELMGV